MKTYIVVGGSKGIGNAIVTTLLENHKVINISRSKPETEHEHLKHYSCDVLKEDLPDIEAADGLVYCPGSINLKPIGRFDLDEFREDFEINVIGAVKTIQKYLNIIKKGKDPSIVLFSTVAAKLGMPFHASVAAAKSGVEGLVKSLGAEMATTLRINAIAPTVTDTQLASKLLRNDKMIENITDRHPMKKFLKPQDVAGMAEFLLSEKASSISGQVFEMDCGIVTFKI
ncbi:SDR family oxidoreductase [Subsaximicrobium wynnwilliamsii]|uniref:SDR family oxidoreductase n=1 Tax=Subsaximicrobium wynnwilliamsii TaxID=291179 RepID=A0A5C6ZCW4_9FLAO|nr:SDR family oxidoreductase [Subsaximicrobium wynnwilliamsii]TXD81305.1 SDR family oxidoreductase [Subsaximicrobium wynnwilliamsii]TXD87326.1 SDR family oxidoreductase [Subsaximicrobium wynnwilliamsii]TXE00931.1 SDR family oxidoreductase [Subsaximicrobium wynnwilliamsii]